MEVLRKSSWWGPAAVFVGHQVLQYGLGVRLGIVDAYLDPLLFLPIMLGLFLQERWCFFGHRRISGLETIIAGLALTLVAEEVFPRWQPAFVHDYWDYLLYAFGLAWFWYKINPPLAANYLR